MKPTITVNQYPIGWEWLDRVPLEDFNWLIEIFSIMTDNTDTYDFVGKVPQPRDKQQPPPLRTHKITDKRNITNPTKRYNHNRYNITTMKKKDLIYIPHQDTWTERFPNPGSNKNDYTLYLSDPQAQYNKLLRTQQKLRNKKK